jgi:hypothetical protein
MRRGGFSFTRIHGASARRSSICLPRNSIFFYRSCGKRFVMRARSRRSKRHCFRRTCLSNSICSVMGGHRSQYGRGAEAGGATEWSASARFIWCGRGLDRKNRGRRHTTGSWARQGPKRADYGGTVCRHCRNFGVARRLRARPSPVEHDGNCGPCCRSPFHAFAGSLTSARAMRLARLQVVRAKHFTRSAVAVRTSVSLG